MGKLKFGVSSIILGKEQKTENLKYDSVEWGEATTIRDFFRAGGNPSPVTPTRCKLLYTAEKLFVLFENMEEKNHHILKEENTVTELTVKRKDILAEIRHIWEREKTREKKRQFRKSSIL